MKGDLKKIHQQQETKMDKIRFLKIIGICNVPLNNTEPPDKNGYMLRSDGFEQDAGDIDELRIQIPVGMSKADILVLLQKAQRYVGSRSEDDLFKEHKTR